MERHMGSYQREMGKDTTPNDQLKFKFKRAPPWQLPFFSASKCPESVTEGKSSLLGTLISVKGRDKCLPCSNTKAMV